MSPPSIEFPVEGLSDGVVRLRLMADGDLPAIVEAVQDPEIARWIPLVPVPYSLDDAERFLASSVRHWEQGVEAGFALVDPVTGDLLGALGLHASDDRRWEIGYWVAPWARRRATA